MPQLTDNGIYAMMNEQLKLNSLFSNSYVLGGSPCSGKSTLAERLSEEYNLPYYKVDDHLWRHLEQADPQLQPTMAAYGKMSWDQIWSQPVISQVRDVFVYYTEQFPMILDDLLAYAGQEPIIMEGVAFLPALVHDWGVPPGQAVFLVPSKAFQTEYYSQRPWVSPILESCADPEEAFKNWMERDHLSGLGIMEQAKTYGYDAITVDGMMGLDALYSKVVRHFQLT